MKNTTSVCPFCQFFLKISSLCCLEPRGRQGCLRCAPVTGSSAAPAGGGSGAGGAGVCQRKSEMLVWVRIGHVTVSQQFCSILCSFVVCEY